MAPADRARAGIGYVPQGREIFPFLTVQENLETALAAAPRGSKVPEEEIYALFPILKQFLKRRGGDRSGGQQQQLAIARALTARPRLLILDEPTEGIQPNAIKDIARIIRLLAREKNLAVVLVEQYYEFARDLADRIAVMVRSEEHTSELQSRQDLPSFPTRRCSDLAARHRPGADGAAAPADPRRADRGHPAQRHQGHRPHHPAAGTGEEPRRGAGGAVLRIRPGSRRPHRRDGEIGRAHV